MEKISLQSNEKSIVPGKGDGYIINLKQNDLPLTSREFEPLLMSKEIIINGLNVKVVGLESFAIAQDSEHSEICLVVKEIP